MQPRPTDFKEPAAITFELYSAEEIRKMSVVEVITPLSISATGQGLPGGLYDPLMGPHNQVGKCGTCQKNLMHCTGHFGHIELPLPVINPLFNKTVLQIFRLSCLNCHTVIVPGPLKYMSIAQLKLLDHGMLEAALNAEAVMAEITGDSEGESKQKAVAVEYAEIARRKFEEYVNSCMIRKQVKKAESSGAMDTERRRIVHRILSLAKINYKCPFCSTVCRRMTQAESKILYSVGKATKLSGRRKGAEESMDIYEEIEKEEEAKGVRQKYLTPLEAKNHLRAVWGKERDFLYYIFPVLQTAETEFPTDNFFIEVLPVTPPKNRPSQTVNNILMEHPHNLAFRQVVTSCTIIQYLLRAMSNGVSSLSDESQKVLQGLHGKSLEEKLENTWNQLQADVDHVMDRDRNAAANQMASQMIGLKQIIERKEGLFRKHMMGKRVNYAARTVITPDPNISIDEIGIPDVFAKVLTYPCTVTPASVYYLRQLVLNGPNSYPGAVAVRDENGTMTRLHPTDQAQREGVANRLLVSDPLKETSFTGIKTVYRHLQNGDMLLLNRQPSLHRPSIMAHRARVLQGEKVFRLHYANCKHYNADFDGDEMNAHFPQDEEARAEAACLANVCNHFLVPKDGTPLGGLIQDHIVGAVKLTIRGRFFTEEDYHELVYFALGGYSKRILLEPPCMLKPMPLWSGKQIVSTIVKNLVPPTKPLLTFTSMAKIKSKEWRQWESRPCQAGGPLKDDDMSESVVIFRQGELLSGVLDKVHLGATAFGLCHAFYELYGSVAVGALLSAFSKLVTNFLQWEGFTLGVKDVLVMPEADKIRRDYMEKASQVGPEAASKGVGLPLDTPIEVIEKNLEIAHRSGDPKRRAMVDQSYKQVLDRFTNKINSTCLPYGLVSIFPHNNLQLLVQSGAKGSTVNTMQMSCLLGQIELEGKRPPLTLAGKSLPSFRPYDMSPRAGGFILGRFLTGIRPQEFFFHCMAGREGLIDTAVKTSRSGYLQRCLVKLLEGVVVNYDMTVRDSDGSVVQFLYGEDGLDVSKSQYLKSNQFPFLQQNSRCVVRGPRSLQSEDGKDEEINHLKSKVKKYGARSIGERQSGFLSFCKIHGDEFTHLTRCDEKTGRTDKAAMLEARWRALSPKEREKYRRKAKRCPDPVLGTYLPTTFGVVSEKLDSAVKGYSDDKNFCQVAYSKAMEALANPGDAVGVLAAQSLGEPSTQMTLNTFHFAGRGEMNVTLGIPRLREILMVASENIKTPCMDIPFKDGITEAQAEKLRLKLTRVTMDQVLQRVEVMEKLDRFGNRFYCMKFVFLPYSEYADTFYVKPNTILRYFEREFIKSSFLPAIRRAMKMRKSQGALHTETENQRSGARQGGEDDDEGNERGGNDRDSAPSDLFAEAERRGQGEEHVSSDEEEEADDADATQSKRQSKQVDLEYEDPEEEERITTNDDDADADTTLTAPENVEENDKEAIDGLLVQDVGEKFSVSKATADLRRSHVAATDAMITAYNFDRKRQEWCELVIMVSQGQEKLNMGLLLQDVAKKSTIHQIPHINRAFVSKKDNKLYIRTEGINILAMAPFQHILDLNRLHCNNIHKMAHHYGIEAALKVLVKELSDVFKAYGIVIDPRHLGLIADYMTRSGVYRPFNRIGIANSSSPLHQMSFETVVNFLREATLAGKKDDLMNPSSRLIVGKPVHVGTDLIECHVSPKDFAQGVQPSRKSRLNRARNENIYCSVSVKQPRRKQVQETSNADPLLVTEAE